MRISDAEWIIMNLVWDCQPVDARQVIDQLAEDNHWSAATVKTMLHRLVKKGVLTHRADGKRYLYRAKVGRQGCVRQASRSFLDRVFGGQAAPALLHFVKNSQLTSEEVEELRELLDTKDQGND
jgi:BlaI family penicillinase repressor